MTEDEIKEWRLKQQELYGACPREGCESTKGTICTRAMDCPAYCEWGDKVVAEYKARIAHIERLVLEMAEQQGMKHEKPTEV